jgi:hypothetical protein
LVPLQVDQLGGAQAVAERDQHDDGVALAPAVGFGGGDQALDLAGGEVLARAQGGVGTATRGDCPINGGWGHQLEMRFGQV